MAIAPAWATAAPASFVDDDFAGGATDANAVVVPPGSVELAPTVAIHETFDGASLPPGVTVTPWSAAGGTATVAGGVLSVDGALVAAPGTYDAGQSLAFRATFT